MRNYIQSLADRFVGDVDDWGDHDIQWWSRSLEEYLAKNKVPIRWRPIVDLFTLAQEVLDEDGENNDKVKTS